MSVREEISAYEFVAQQMALKPDSSIRDLARAAQELKTPLSWEVISQARLRYLVNSVPESNLVFHPEPSVIGRKVMPVCVNCREVGHWASTCTKPKPEPVFEVPIQLTEPVVEEEQPVETKPDEEVAPTIGVAPLPSEPAPSAWKKADTANRMMRRQFLNELLDADPGAHPMDLMSAVRKKFGVGLDHRYVYATCRVAREVHKLPQIPEREDPNGRVYRGREGLPQYEAPAESEYADNADDECLWLAKQAGDVMRAHGLTELHLTVQNGKAHWTYVKTGSGGVDL